MSKSSLFAALVFTVSVPALALAQSGGTQPTGGNTVSSVSGAQSGQQFLKQVEQDSINEIHEGLLAEQRAQDPAVRAYARLMIDDHTMLASELGAVANETSFKMTGVSMSQGGTNKLQNLNGTQFDRAFIDHEVTQHRQSVQHWQREAQAKNGNSTIEAFAKLGLPVQREHLALGEAIQAQLKNSGG
jgi:putative membrane protein